LSAGRGSVEGNVSWERGRTQGQRAALTPCCSRLGYLALLQRHYPHLGLLAGEDSHAAPTKRLNTNVRRLRSPPKSGGGFPAERPGGIRCFVVGTMPLNYHCIELSKPINGDCRAARPAPPPNKRMNPPRYFMIGKCLWKSKFSNFPLFVR
jgi:hypothetical protein